MTVNVNVTDTHFGPDEPEVPQLIIQLPFWDEDMAEVFWPAVNAPEYQESIKRTAALVRYVHDRAFWDGHQAGVRSILGRDS